jgi:hypothetical protein
MEQALDKLQWDYIDVEDDYVFDIKPRNELTSEQVSHIANEKLKIQEGLRYISDRADMDRQMRKADKARRENNPRRQV